MARMSRGLASALMALVGAALFSEGCSCSGDSAGGGGGFGGGVETSSGGGGAGGNIPQQDDFQKPVLDSGAPANSSSLFGAVGQPSGGPCLFEPEIGSLFPNNWLPPRFRFIPAKSENLFEIKLVIPHETSPLLV